MVWGRWAMGTRERGRKWSGWCGVGGDGGAGDGDAGVASGGRGRREDEDGDAGNRDFFGLDTLYFKALSI